jgi:hypothetical protein
MNTIQLYFSSFTFLILLLTSCASENTEQASLDISTQLQYRLKTNKDTLPYKTQLRFKTEEDTASYKRVDLTRIIFQYPLLDTQTNSVLTKKINASIQAELCLNQAGDMAYQSVNQRMDDFIQDFKENQAEFKKMDLKFASKWLSEININVLLNNGYFISYQIDETNFTGGAHANVWKRFYNFSVKNTTKLTLDDIFLENYEGPLSKIAENYFKKAVGLSTNTNIEETDFEFESGAFELSPHFALQKDALHFYYNPYDLGPFALGEVSFSIPYVEIRPLLHQNIVRLESF